MEINPAKVIAMPLSLLSSCNTHLTLMVFHCSLSVVASMYLLHAPQHRDVVHHVLRDEVSGPISADENSELKWKRKVKKNEKQKKNEKRIRKTEKELNLDLASASATRRLHSQYLVYDGYAVNSTQPTVSCEWYYDYKNDSRYSVHEGIGSVLGLWW